jgi:hypothetical protein
MKFMLVALALACMLFGCGSDGVFFISFASGTIADDPTCRSNGGQFNLRDQGGLLVLVIINSDTLIFVGSGQGTCHDLGRNDPVNVRGPRQGSQITAQRVQVE